MELYVFNTRNCTTGWEGRNGARCFFTPIGPMPGPPPPWGMQNVLWRLRWQTSAPIQPGLVRPTCEDQRYSQKLNVDVNRQDEYTCNIERKNGKERERKGKDDADYELHFTSSQESKV